MPTYEYSCDACGHSFEKFELMTAKPTKECPKCEKKKARRTISGGAGFIFRGGGFYTTDYRSASYKEAAKKDSSTSSAPASSADAPCSNTACNNTSCAKKKKTAAA